MCSSICLVLVSCSLIFDGSSAQAVISGRVRQPTVQKEDTAPSLGGIRIFAEQKGSSKLPLADCSWNNNPSGWYRLAGPPAAYTVLASDPAGYMRPVLLPDMHAELGPNAWDIHPHADYAVFSESDWDRQPAEAYCQPFVARGRSVTHVGFELADDGVDGAGPGGQDLEVCIRRIDAGPPGNWKPIGPAVPVLGVDCGGAKNRAWSVGWNSGEVEVECGKCYAVCLRALRPSGVFQAYWQTCPDAAACCYRKGRHGELQRTGFRLWMSVASDDDAIVIPYNKRVHREYGEFAGFARKWSQTYVAQGDSLAGVLLYAAVGGSQPPLNRQRVAMRVRRDGTNGPVVGVEKTAIGNGLYTGDASWGVFGAAFARGEVPLLAGRTYAIEIETLETPQSLRGFVNIKGQVSDERPGFNPYRKVSPDTYARGTAFRDGRERVAFDLDMQIIEFAAGGGRSCTAR